MANKKKKKPARGGGRRPTGGRRESEDRAGKISRYIETAIIVVIAVLIAYLVISNFQPQLKKLAADIKKTALQTEQAAETEETEEEGGELPSSYDSRENGKAPTVKSQGNLGTCWALAATSAVEANLLPEEVWNFSADHMSMHNGYSREQNDGGAYTMAMAYLVSWTGPVREEDDPYGDGVSPDGLTAVKHVQEMHMLKDASLEDMKREVRRYGALQSSVYVAGDGGFTNTFFYNSETCAYCYTGEEPANHDILIIGWDDAYPAENFAGGAAADGAFLCQNSWGEGFGDNGVFYVSYEDARIRETATSCAVVEDTDNYDAIYQSDLCGWVGQLGYGEETCYAANVYTPKSDEQLEAVGFYAVGADTSYEIFIAPAFENENSLVMWTPAAEGSLALAGYYTVRLPETVRLTAGQPFAVVIKLTTPGTEYPIAAEYRAGEDTQDVILDDGQGYISRWGYAWDSTETAFSCNVCLKAYTSLAESSD